MDKTSDESFSTELRLRQSAEFKAVFAAGKPVRRGVFLIRNRANDCGTARLGMAVPARAVRKAVARNRIKRLIRESFRKHRKELPERDYVVLYQNTRAQPNETEMKQALSDYWSRENTRAGKTHTRKPKWTTRA